MSINDSLSEFSARWSLDESTDCKADLHVPENAVDKLILDFIVICGIFMTLFLIASTISQIFLVYKAIFFYEIEKLFFDPAALIDAYVDAI